MWQQACGARFVLSLQLQHTPACAALSGSAAQQLLHALAAATLLCSHSGHNPHTSPHTTKLDARRSLLLDKFEFLQPENAYDAFSFFHRVVLSPIAHHFGASFADLLNVAGFTCVSALGGIEYIPEVCDAQKVPLKVRAHAVCVRALAAHSRALRCL